MRTQVLMAAIGLALTGFGAGYPTDLIYYSKLDSAADITAPQVGAAGTVSGATFQEGKVGNALYAPAHSDVAQIPFANGLEAKGCIEFDLKLLNSNTYFGAGCDPYVFGFLSTDSTHLGRELFHLHFNANDGSGNSGLLVSSTGGKMLISTWPNKSGFQVPYADILGTEDPMGWHHYKIVWNSNGLSGGNNTLAVYIDGNLHVSGLTDASAKDSFFTAISEPSRVIFSTSKAGSAIGGSPFLIDELKVWKTDTPSEDPVELPVVSAVTAKQHYPWCGKVDIGYTVAGSTDGLLVKISVKDNDNNVTYEAKTFDVKPTAAAGAHTVVWDATKDGVNKVSKNMVATVSLIVPAE